MIKLVEKQENAIPHIVGVYQQGKSKSRKLNI